MNLHYDVIIIGTGAGGGTLAHSLSETGKNILILERGTFLPREVENWDTVAVFQKERYHAEETWLDKKNRGFRPGTGYWVGGNTKVYGGALFRLRERDFETVIHKGGISPEWPLKYQDFEPYYAEAEKLYHVHGRKGEDPTDPPMSCDYPHDPIRHEPRIQEIHQALLERKLKPFYTPLGMKLNEKNMLESVCIRCRSCDGFPCAVDAKADSDLCCVRPIHKKSNVTLLTGTKVLRLLSSPSGREITGVQAEQNGEVRTFTGSLVVLACGAANSAAILLSSANEAHPNGMANSSDQVGRNFMKHNNAAILNISRKKNPTVFQKTMSVNDFYWGEEGFDYPMGHVSLLGKANKDMLVGDAPFFTPKFLLEKMAQHSVDWWLTNEDLPDPANRITCAEGGQIKLDYTPNNTESFDRLLKRWVSVLKKMDSAGSSFPAGLYLTKKIPLGGVAHQVGTCRFGVDPKTSVLDVHCRTHDVDNLYVVDGSFFPSSGAVNPSLTIIANAIRVAKHLSERLKSSP